MTPHVASNPGRHRLRLALLAALLCAPAGVLAAPTPLLSVWFVPDITVLLNGATVSPRELAVDDLVGNITRVSLGELPEGTRIVSFVRLSGGDQFLTFDTTVDLGDFTARPGDVVRFDGSNYSLFLDATAVGIPDGAIVDALTLANGETLGLSFDVTVKLGDLTVSPADIVLIDGADRSLLFDAAAAGVAPGLDLDAAYVSQSNGRLLLSFDGSGIIGNPPVTFDDEDVLEYDPTDGSWLLAYDGSVQAPGWPPADLKGLLAVEQPQTPTPSATPVTVATGTATRTAAATPLATASATAQVPTATVTGSPPATATPTTGSACAGDCNGDGTVTIDELILMVNIALENAPVSECEAGDTTGNGSITINELIAAVVDALGSCPA